jgi:CBS domain-containing protein
MGKELLVKDVRTNKVIHLDKGKSVYDAACVMKENNISSVVVLDKNTICGIATERDITQKVIAARLDPGATSLGAIMSSPVKTIDEGQTIVDAARMMRDLKIKKLVVTKDRTVVGIISERDILEMDPALHSEGTG